MSPRTGWVVRLDGFLQKTVADNRRHRSFGIRPLQRRSEDPVQGAHMAETRPTEMSYPANRGVLHSFPARSLTIRYQEARMCQLRQLLPEARRLRTNIRQPQQSAASRRGWHGRISQPEKLESLEACNPRMFAAEDTGAQKLMSIGLDMTRVYDFQATSTRHDSSSST